MDADVFTCICIPPYTSKVYVHVHIINMSIHMECICSYPLYDEYAYVHIHYVILVNYIIHIHYHVLYYTMYCIIRMRPGGAQRPIYITYEEEDTCI